MPTGTDPVKLILRTIVEANNFSEISAGTPKTRLTTPSGTPASERARINATAVPGVSSDAFKIMEQPAANAGASFLAGRNAGKFQGVNPSATPTGSTLTL